MTKIIVLLGLLLTLVGCTAPSKTIDGIATAEPKPASITIPRIQANSTLIPTGLNADGTLEVPNVYTPEQASYYDRFPMPGDFIADEPGQTLSRPAVILGHVNGGGKPGVFARLAELGQFGEFWIKMTDGSERKFIIYKKLVVHKQHFPTDEIYGRVAEAEVRLITCGGKLDRTGHNYEDNIVIFAKKV